MPDIFGHFESFYYSVTKFENELVDRYIEKQHFQSYYNVNLDKSIHLKLQITTL